jgi:spore germination protein GerM
VSCSGSNSVHLIAANQLPADLYGKPNPGGARTQQFVVYFIRGNRLVPQNRTASSSLTIAQQAMRELLKGPTPEEQADGLSTAIPANAALLSVEVDSQKVATVNLSQEFEQAAEPRAAPFRFAQIVYTLTEPSDVDNVRFFVEGGAVTAIDQDGSPVNGIVGRGRYSRLSGTEKVTPVDPCTLVESLGSCQSTSTAGAP